MKHRLFYRFAIVPILVVVVGSSCVGVLSLLLPQPVAQAAGNGNSCSPLSPTLPSSPLNPSCPIPSGGSAASTIPVTIGPWQNVAFTFTDRANISVTSSSFGTVDFVDKDIGDNNYNYAPTSGPFCNKQGITIPSTPNWSDPNISANLTLGNQTGNKCNNVTSNDITIGNPQDANTGQPAAETVLQWNGNNISTLNGVSSVATYTPGAGATGLYIEQTSHVPDCHAYSAIVLNSGSTTTGTKYDLTNNLTPDGSVSKVPALAPYFSSSCDVSSKSSVIIDGQQGTTPPGAPGGAGGASSPGVSCDLGITGLNLSSIFAVFNPLNWLLCGIIQGADGIVNKLDAEITSWLVIGTNGDTSTDNPGTIFAFGSNNSQCTGKTFTNSTGGTETECEAYYTAWAAFRDLALGLLAIICLGIIIAQALGMDILDAYTIRKMLPRVVAGAIILTLSWPLMRFFVTLSNDLGYGIGSLLNAPFAGLTDSFHTGNIFTDLGAAIGGLALGFFGLLSFIGTAALAVLVAFLTLVFRQIAVILLIIFSPIAIIAYALPNTQRVYKFWWESFSKLLLMFPLIVAMITIGHIFSALSSQNTDPVNQIIAVIAYFAPYFMIPFTFRFSGGIMSGVGNAINSNGLINGARGGLGNFRKNKFKQNMTDLASGERIKGTKYEGGIMGKYSAAARQFNRGTKGATNFSKNAGYNPRSWKARMQAGATTDADVRAREAREKNKDVQALEGDDDLLKTGIKASQENKGDNFVRQMLKDRKYENVEEGVALVRAARANLRPDVFEAAAIPMLFGSKSGLDPEMEEYTDAEGNVRHRAVGDGAGEGRQMIVKSARGSKQRVIKLLGASRQAGEQAGRSDLVARSYTEDLADTWALMNEGNSDAAAKELTMRTMDSSLEGTARARVMGGSHKRAVSAMSQRLADRVDEAATVVSGQERANQAEDAFFQYATLGQTLNASASGPIENMRIMKTNVLDKVRTVASLPAQVRQELGPAAYETVVKRQFNAETKVFEEAKVQQLKEKMSDAEINEGLRTYSPTYGRINREYSNRGEVPAAIGANAAAATAEAATEAANAANQPPQGPAG
jgi:hypothetical protein